MSPRLTGVVGDTEHVEVAGGGAEQLVDGRSPPESSRRKVSNCQDLRNFQLNAVSSSTLSNDDKTILKIK